MDRCVHLLLVLSFSTSQVPALQLYIRTTRLNTILMYNLIPMSVLQVNKITCLPLVMVLYGLVNPRSITTSFEVNCTDPNQTHIEIRLNLLSDLPFETHIP